MNINATSILESRQEAIKDSNVINFEYQKVIEF